MIYTAIDRQNLFDIALMGNGTAEAAFDIAYKNNMLISKPISSGSNVTVNLVSNKKVVSFFAARNLKPATSDVLRTITFDPTFDHTFEEYQVTTMS